MNNIEEFEKEIFRLKEEIIEIKERLSNLEEHPAVPEPIDRGISIREFLNKRNPENDIMKCFYIMSFLELHKGYKSCNSKDIEEGLREAREIVPSQLHNKLFRLVERGYIMEVEKKDSLKAYILTNTGINKVNNEGESSPKQ